MAKPSKKPTWKNTPTHNKKEPKGGDRVESENSRNFCWRTDWIDLDGPWSFRNASCEKIWKEIVPRLHDFETQTWGELYGLKNGSTHPMPVDKIEQDAQDRLRSLGRDEFETLFQLNVRGGIRLWGIRDRQIFYLIWYDPNHSVYIQKKDS
jgi:hypothetical protein